jgi:hypothetical protein
VKRSIARPGSAASALALGLALPLLLGACSGPAGADVYGSDCRPRASKVDNDVSLNTALERQAAENRTYRECLERRAVRVAR